MSNLNTQNLNNTEINYQHHIKRFEEKHNSRAKLTPLGKVAVGVVAGLAIIGGAKIASPNYEISSATVPVTVKPGEGLNSIINRTTINASTVNINELSHAVKELPSNQDVFENGQLDVGESVDVPAEVIK